MDSKTGGTGQPQRTRRTNVPMVLTSFVGREREVAELTKLLTSSRLVTLTGTAGCGKTRLALRLAADATRQYVDGIQWIELARLTQSDVVPDVVARAVNVAEQPDHPMLDRLLDALSDKNMLLVLDNCEHLIEACKRLVDLLLAAPGLTILATSREALGVTGEMRYPLLPMAVPPVSLSPEQVGQFEAVQLFVERARAVVPDFALTPDNAGTVADICRRLDGVPLAIELASARVSVLTVEQVATRLSDTFGVLGMATHLTYSYHRTLRAAIDWSYDSLSAPEQMLLQRLSVFVAGCSLAAAEVVCAGDGIDGQQVLDLLSSLVSKSLVLAQTLQPGEARYALLETIRQYAQEQLLASGAWAATHDRFLHCFLRLAEEAEPKLIGDEQQRWLAWLEAEYDNVRAALAWSLDSQRIDAGLRIAIALREFWMIRNYTQEGLAWFTRLLAQTDDQLALPVRAAAFSNAAILAMYMGDPAASIEYGRQAVALGEAAGDEGRPILAFALVGVGSAMRAAGDYQALFAINEQIIQLYRELGDPFYLGSSLMMQGKTAMVLGRFALARALFNESLSLATEAGATYRVALVHSFFGDLARCEQNYAQAQESYETSLPLLRQLGAARDLALVLCNQGHACLHMGNVERACALFTESMAEYQAQRSTPGVADCLVGLAGTAIVQDSPAAGARLLAAASRLGGSHVAIEWSGTRVEYDYYLGLARSGLTDEELETEQAAGRSLTLEQAIKYAQNLPLKVTATREPRRKQDELTQREREVAVLIARGKSNGEIAGALVVSKRTVEKHIANILSKLGFTNRAQVVRWGVENELAGAQPRD